MTLALHRSIIAAVAAPVVFLEPLSTGDVIDASVRIYRRNLRPFLGVLAAPFVFGAAAWLALTFGLAALDTEGSGVSPMVAAFLVVGGLFCYLAYSYLMFLALGGISRCVGDSIMLGEQISARAVLRAVNGRLMALTSAALLLVAVGVGIGFLLVLVAGLGFFIVGLAVMVMETAGFGQAAVAAVAGLAFLAILLIVIFVVLPLALARFIFVPQIVMIEGATAFAALGRAFALGARNWNRVLGIWMFSLCSSYALALAVMTPILLVLWMLGLLALDLETIESIQGGVSQFSGFLVVPVWAVSFTLLYFDNRVRKEGYDVDLLFRRLPPAPAFAYQGHSVALPGQHPPGPQAAQPGPIVAPGRCPQCGRYITIGTPRCPGCGWRPQVW